MRIANRTIYQNIDFQLMSIAEQLKIINEQIASSKRINHPSDDPIGFTHALELKKVLSQINQYGRNIQHGESWLNTTESALSSINELIVRAKGLAQQMATGTYSADQRRDAAVEIQNIIKQLVQVGNTRLNGHYIFSGYKDTTPAFTDDLAIHGVLPDPGNGYTGTATSSGTFTELYSETYLIRITTGGDVGVAEYQVSEDGGATWGPVFTTSPLPTPVYSSVDQGARIAFTATSPLTVGDEFTIEVSQYSGDQHDIEINVGQSARMTINLTGDAISGEAGDTENNYFDILVGLKASLENNDITGVQSAMDQLNTVQTHLTHYLADLGSRLNRIEMHKNILSDLEANNTKRLSDIEDLDVVKAIIDLNAKQAVYQAALYSASQLFQLSLVDYMP